MALVALSEPAELGRPLVDKLGRVVALTAAERAYLQDMQADFAAIRSRGDIITAGYTYQGIFVLNRGTAIRYKILRDGRRQVLGVFLPGDFIGFPGGLFEKALYSVSSLTDAVVCAIPFDAIFELFHRFPRLAAALFWLTSRDTALFTERLVGIGRQSAYERVAHLLLELLVRLQGAGLADARSYEMPLTQELMADALGLSVPHVNRTLRRLRDEGLISIDGQRVTFSDVDHLSREVDFDRAYLGIGTIPRKAPAL
jgi:CRP-like cAMP-binding protein